MRTAHRFKVTSLTDIAVGDLFETSLPGLGAILAIRLQNSEQHRRSYVLFPRDSSDPLHADWDEDDDETVINFGKDFAVELLNTTEAVSQAVNDRPGTIIAARNGQLFARFAPFSPPSRNLCVNLSKLAVEQQPTSAIYFTEWRLWLAEDVERTNGSPLFHFKQSNVGR